MLRDVVGGAPHRADLHDNRTPEVLAGDALYGRRHRGGEHVSGAVYPVRLQHSIVLRLEVGRGHGLHDAKNLGLESHINHAVGLIEDHIVALIEDGVVPLQAVDHAAWCGHDDLAAPAELEALLLDGLPADDVCDTEAGVLRQLAGFLINLEDQLTRRRHHQGVRALGLDLFCHGRLLLDVNEHWQNKGGGFATPGLSKPDDIALLEADGNGCHLNGGRLLVACLVDSLPEGLRQRALVPAAVGQRRIGPAVRNVEVLTEDAPVPLRHVGQRLGAPVGVCAHVVLVVLGSPVKCSLLPLELLRCHLLAVTHLGQQFPLMLRCRLLLLASVRPRPHPSPKQQRRLVQRVVQRVQVFRGVLCVLPVKVELELL
mmetsp:Transcript_27138/g.76569  ORF Transcript_27138/g.76569 Transcript_27138/m.76569 type:complete len:371 (-) Transcript_27138:887-1999(-)